MGWNDFRVSLVPTGWAMTRDVDPSSRTSSGKPVSILQPRPNNDGRHATQNLARLEAWLGERGFELAESSPSSRRLTRGDIETFLVLTDGVLSECLLTFTLTPVTPDRLGEWIALVAALVESSGCQLVDRRDRRVIHWREFAALLTTGTAWRSFAGKYGWTSEAGDSDAEAPAAGVPGPSLAG